MSGSSPKWVPQAVATAVAAAGDGLGQPQTQHWRTARLVVFFHAFIVLVSAGIAVICCASPYVFFTEGRLYTPAFVGVGLTLLGTGYAALLVTTPRRPVGVVAFERGLVRVTGTTAQVVPWTEIRTVWQRETLAYDKQGRTNTLASTFDLTIETSTGARIRVNELFEEAKSLGERIVAELARLRQAEVAERLARGQSEQFGPFRLEPAGFSNGEQTLPWSRVALLEVVKERLRLAGEKRPWSRAKVGDIPNFYVYLTIARSLANSPEAHGWAGNQA